MLGARKERYTKFLCENLVWPIQGYFFPPLLFFVAKEKEGCRWTWAPAEELPAKRFMVKKKKKGTTNRGKKTLRRYDPAHTKRKKETKGNRTQSQEWNELRLVKRKERYTKKLEGRHDQDKGDEEYFPNV